MATRTSVGSGLWSAAGTWDTGVPGDGDSVVIAAGHTVTFDVDQSGFATGLAGLAVVGELEASLVAGTYYLKAAGSITGSGILRAGSDPDAGGARYPTTCTFTIYMNGNYSINGSGGLRLQLWCTNPTYPVLQLISASAKPITSISRANPCIVGCVGHGLTAGNELALANVGGMLEVTDRRFEVYSTPTPDSFGLRWRDSDIAVDSSTFTPWTSGGLVVPDSAEAVGATQLEVDRDVTGDPCWTAAGAQVVIADIARGFERELRTLSGVAAGYLTISAGLTAAKNGGAYVALITRNVRVLGSAVVISNGIIMNGSGHRIDAQVMPNPGTSGNGLRDVSSSTAGGALYADSGTCIYGGSGNTLSGVASGSTGIRDTTFLVMTGTVIGCSTGLQTVNDAVVSGQILGCSKGVTLTRRLSFTGRMRGCETGHEYGFRCAIGGVITGCTVGVAYGNGHTLTGLIDASSTGISYSIRPLLRGVILGCSTGAGYCSRPIINGRITHCVYGLTYGFADLLGAYLGANSSDVAYAGFTAINSTLASTSEQIGLPAEAGTFWLSQSFDHDASAGAFRAWSAGGQVDSTAVVVPTGRPRSYQHACASATYPCWHQREITVDAGRQLRARVWLRHEAGVAVVAQLVLPTDDPLLDAAATAEDTFDASALAADTWHEDVLVWTNTATYPQQILLRFLATAAAGNAYSDLEWSYDRTPRGRHGIA